jgi:hypothetical protein
MKWKFGSARLQLNPLTDQHPQLFAEHPNHCQRARCRAPAPSAAGIFDDYVVHRPFTPPLAGLVSTPVLTARVLGSSQQMSLIASTIHH